MFILGKYCFFLFPFSYKNEKEYWLMSEILHIWSTLAMICWILCRHWVWAPNLFQARRLPNLLRHKAIHKYWLIINFNFLSHGDENFKNYFSKSMLIPARSAKALIKIDNRFVLILEKVRQRKKKNTWQNLI